MNAGKFVNDFADVVGDAVKGKSILHSNEAVNPLKKGIGNFTGGLEYIGRVINGEGFNTALKNTFADVTKEKGQEVVKWNAGKIAGSYLGASAAYRIASGGGVYKDGNGNTNLIGVPFV